jgi:ubiquinone/menaquinone biosynthesis C-methylase UbiE
VVKEYYDTRAPEYDEWYLGLGKFAGRERPGWHEAVRELEDAVASLPPASTLDVACGTGFLTRHLRGEVTGLDQSERMLEIAHSRIPGAAFVRGDATRLPFGDDAFDRVFTGHFYGHLDPETREGFLTEARRVARELVVVDSAVRPDHERDEWQERVLNDGSRFQVYKRYFDADELARELGNGTVLHSSDWFVMAAALLSP